VYKGPPGGAVRSRAAAPERGEAKRSGGASLRGRRSLSDRILHAVSLSTGRRGASLIFIKKAIGAEGYDVARNKGRLKAAIAAMLEKGLLQRVTGSGVAGSFRIGPVGKERLEGAAQRGRAARKTRQRPAVKKKKKSPRRAQKSTAKRLNRGRKPRKKAAKRMVGGVEEIWGDGTPAAEGDLGAREME
uniref:H15 domain-containing protein n=1 Tax=Strix occidentalis caurina TaxID=311401 RepID=A0A8D0FQ75_STROC